MLEREVNYICCLRHSRFIGSEVLDRYIVRFSFIVDRVKTNRPVILPPYLGNDRLVEFD